MMISCSRCCFFIYTHLISLKGAEHFFIVVRVRRTVCFNATVFLSTVRKLNIFSVFPSKRFLHPQEPQPLSLKKPSMTNKINFNNLFVLGRPAIPSVTIISISRQNNTGTTQYTLVSLHGT